MVNEEQLEKAYKKGKVIFNKLVKDEHMRIANEFSDDQVGEEAENDECNSSSEDDQEEEEEEVKIVSIRQSRRSTKKTRTASKTMVMVLIDCD